MKVLNAYWPPTSWWCALACLLSACQAGPPHAERLTRSQPLLGTLVTISVYGGSVPSQQQAIDAAFAEVRAADQLLSIHREDSRLSHLNLAAAAGPASVDAELFRVLQEAFLLAARSGGAFDPTVRPLVDLWGFLHKERFHVPSEPELREALGRVGHRHVHFDDKARTLRFNRPGMSIDPGGFGKGYAVDRAIERLRACGVTAAMVKAGGDLRVLGLPPGQDHWVVQIEDPAKRGQRVPIALRGGALSTSGNYENFFEANGVRYGHLLDPRTGRPVDGVLSCTVTAATCLEADALATACSVLGPEASLMRFGASHGLRILTLQAGVERVHQSPRFPR